MGSHFETHFLVILFHIHSYFKFTKLFIRQNFKLALKDEGKLEEINIV